MAKIRDYREISMYLKNTQSAYKKGYVKGLMALTLEAEKLAKQNTQDFNITAKAFGRRRSGGLNNAIFSGFTDGNNITSFIGTRGIPYGRIHELGGDITPKKAKNLWVKINYDKPFKRLSPREFMELRKSTRSISRNQKRNRDKGVNVRKSPSRGTKETYDFFRSKKGNLIAARIKHLKPKKDITPLFLLKKKVTIPSRPFLQPAIDDIFGDKNKLKIMHAMIINEFLKLK